MSDVMNQSPQTGTASSKPFWDGMAEGRFMLQESPATGKLQFFPRPSSTSPRGATVWREASGLGSLMAFTICRVPAAGFEQDAPYVMGVVKLAEGPRVMAPLASTVGDALEVGMAVRLVWRRLGPHERVYHFEPDRHPPETP